MLFMELTLTHCVLESWETLKIAVEQIPKSPRGVCSNGF